MRGIAFSSYGACQHSVKQRRVLDWRHFKTSGGLRTPRTDWYFPTLCRILTFTVSCLDIPGNLKPCNVPLVRHFFPSAGFCFYFYILGPLLFAEEREWSAIYSSALAMGQNKICMCLPMLRQLNVAGQALTSSCSRQHGAPDWQSQISPEPDIHEQDSKL